MHLHDHQMYVTLPNIRKGLVKMTFQSHLQYGSFSKRLSSLKVYFRAVLEADSLLSAPRHTSLLTYGCTGGAGVQWAEVSRWFPTAVV